MDIFTGSKGLFHKAAMESGVFVQWSANPLRWVRGTGTGTGRVRVRVRVRVGFRSVECEPVEVPNPDPNMFFLPSLPLIMRPCQPRRKRLR